MSQMTKRALEASLKELLRHKPLDKITVSDLTDHCGVNRMTFYYHFKDIYDLVEWCCEEDAARALAGQRKTVFLPEGFALGVALIDGKAQCFELFGPQCLLAICNQCAAGTPALLGSIHHK